jgi:catechol 2,3-dioxygenase-like lactoylglutathione lyase family enzyme
VLVDAVGAILLISDDAKRLAGFYRDALGFPLESEAHEGVPPHYACEVGGVHLAIHPSDGWPGERAPNAQSPVLVFHTRDVQAAYERLVAHGVPATPPFDHGFAILTAFEDPDGNNIQILTPTA